MPCVLSALLTIKGKQIFLLSGTRILYGIITLGVELYGKNNERKSI